MPAGISVANEDDNPELVDTAAKVLMAAQEEAAKHPKGVNVGSDKDWHLDAVPKELHGAMDSWAKLVEHVTKNRPKDGEPPNPEPDDKAVDLAYEVASEMMGGVVYEHPARTKDG